MNPRESHADAATRLAAIAAEVEDNLKDSVWEVDGQRVEAADRYVWLDMQWLLGEIRRLEDMVQRFHEDTIAVTERAQVAEARLSELARERDAETTRANVMEHERDFEQQVVVPSARDKIERYEAALREIESFPLSGYHAGQAQRIAHEIVQDFGASTTVQSGAVESSSSTEEGSSPAGPGDSRPSSSVVDPGGV